MNQEHREKMELIQQISNELLAALNTVVNRFIEKYWQVVSADDLINAVLSGSVNCNAFAVKWTKAAGSQKSREQLLSMNLFTVYEVSKAVFDGRPGTVEEVEHKLDFALEAFLAYERMWKQVSQ